MDKYAGNDNIEAIVKAIVDKEISGYKERLKSNMLQHLNGLYCAKTDIGTVMYQKEILDVIEKTK